MFTFLENIVSSIVKGNHIYASDIQESYGNVFISMFLVKNLKSPLVSSQTIDSFISGFSDDRKVS